MPKHGERPAQIGLTIPKKSVEVEPPSARREIVSIRLDERPILAGNGALARGGDIAIGKGLAQTRGWIVVSSEGVLAGDRKG